MAQAITSVSRDRAASSSSLPDLHRSPHPRKKVVCSKRSWLVLFSEEMVLPGQTSTMTSSCQNIQALRCLLESHSGYEDALFGQKEGRMM